jgi:hypothetical protein
MIGRGVARGFLPLHAPRRHGKLLGPGKLDAQIFIYSNFTKLSIKNWISIFIIVCENNDIHACDMKLFIKYLFKCVSRIFLSVIIGNQRKMQDKK